MKKKLITLSIINLDKFKYRLDYLYNLKNKNKID